MAKLKPRARLIRTIGDKLISGPEAAIIELVKNSYDADSAKVTIKIVPPIYQDNDIKLALVSEGEIIISDQGHGMTYDEIIGIWLEPATDSKVKNSTSRSGKRTVLGAKGVGRFATASLGKTLNLCSIAENKNGLEESLLKLDWDVFETTKYLEDIDIDITKADILVENQSVGVTVSVKGLRHIWEENRLETLIQELRRLATPQMHSDLLFEIELDLSSFTLSAERNEYLNAVKIAKNKKEVPQKYFSPYDFDGVELLERNNTTLNSLISGSGNDNSNFRIKPYSLGEHCDYMVKGAFSCEGTFKGELTILRGDKVPKKLELPALSLGVNQKACAAFSVELMLYDLEPASIKRLFKDMGLNYDLFTLAKSRKFISENTGVAIYRNSFRVRPYGHHDHDWLNLEKRRVQNPSHRIGHGQISGSILIADEEVSGLIERSSREGLEQNGSFFRLKELVTNLLLNIEATRFQYREKAGISRPAKKDFKEAFEVAALNKVNKAIDSIETLSIEDRASIQKAVNKSSKEMEKVLKGMKAYLQLLESRVSLGDVVAQVLHEGRTYLTPINAAASFYNKHTSKLGEQTPMGEGLRKLAPDYTAQLDGGAAGISALFADIDPVSGRKRGKPTKFNILSVIEKVGRLTSSYRADSEVFIELNVTNKHEAFGYAADLQSALMNVYTNAIHWLSLQNKARRTISVESKINKDKVIVTISNNCPFINDMHEEKLFDAGFTLKTSGHGLGLVIAREAIRNSEGDITYKPKDGTTSFEIELPAVMESKEIENN
jgi:signal transduction histidine kinase